MHINENLVIIGSGPAAFTAAVYASRSNLKPLLIEGKKPGGQLMSTTYVENWPGTINILGPKLIQELKSHAIHFGTRILNEEVIQANLSSKPFTLTTNKNSVIKCNALIIATGATPKKLNCEGEEFYWGKGVTTCAVCDGPFYRDKKVVIVGGGDSAMENASFMTNFTQDITIVHILPNLTASHAMQQRVLNNPNIKIIYKSTVTQISGTDHEVSSVTITNQKTRKQTLLKAEGVIISIGLQPNVEIFQNQINLTKSGHVALKKHSHTSIDGVFAAGDVADERYRQAITSAGTGCAAALDAERYLNENIFL